MSYHLPTQAIAKPDTGMPVPEMEIDDNLVENARRPLALGEEKTICLQEGKEAVLNIATFYSSIDQSASRRI
ncbi:MAG: hypothetical protein IPM26_00005 [Saprospiraceae bacterium]|nr:hypothetical protein [Saprospiraceae bacterium]